MVGSALGRWSNGYEHRVFSVFEPSLKIGRRLSGLITTFSRMVSNWLAAS
jgi:hypothetical protein